MKKQLTSIFAALLCCVLTSAQQSQPVPVDPAVRVGHLENGLTYIIRKNAEPAGQANFYIAQKVGSILEEENQRGLAHFLEHMCFNGTEHFPGNSLIKYCESIGVKFGENLNAYTSIDETVYNIDNVPVGKVPSAVDSCLWILHDWADGLLLADKDIDNERGVIHEEWRTRANAQIRLLEKILPVIYPDGNRYGNRMPIGTMEVVDNFEYDVLRSYYQKWYRPDLQGIIVVGDIDVDEVEGKIRDIFGTIATPVNPAERVYYSVPDNEEPIICLAQDKEQPYALSYIFFKHEPYPFEMRSDMNYYIYSSAMAAATLMLNDRLQEMLQKPEPPFIAAQVSDGDYLISRTKSGLCGLVVSSEEGLSAAVSTVYREMLRAIRCGFTESEFERTKARLLTEIESAYNSRDKRKSADYCTEYVRHFIDNEPIPGIEFEYSLFNQLSSVITVEMVNQILSGVVDQNRNLAMFSMLPQKEGVEYPSEEQMASLLASVRAEDIQPYVDAVSDEPLMSELPQPGKVVKVKPAGMGYTRYDLSNGATVYFRPTDFNPDEVIMTASSRGGTSLYSATLNSDLKVVSDVMNIGGVGNFSVTELNKVLAGKKVKVNAEVGIFGENVSASSTPKDLETMFQLNYLTFTSMRKDQDAFESWVGREKASITNRQNNPLAAVQDTLLSTIYFNSNRAEDVTVEDLENIDYDRILHIASQRFADAADFTFIITGAVTEEVLVPLLEQYVATLPAHGAREKADLTKFGFRNGSFSNVFEREMEVPMTTSFFFDYADMKYSLKNKLSYNLGLNALSTVLLEEIREKEGGTYGIGAYGDLSGIPAPRQQAYMQIAYQTDPQKYEYLNSRVREIVADFAENGPSEENLAKGKEFYQKKHQENLRENSYWSEVFANYLETGVDMTRDFDSVLDGITAKDVRKIMSKMLAANNHSEVIMVGT
ncbi:MAG: M16 family metallopeptidase, partial [Candidatus Cryptobacteroides sp.]